MKAKILADFQICMSVPLTKFYLIYRFLHFYQHMLFHFVDRPYLFLISYKIDMLPTFSGKLYFFNLLLTIKRIEVVAQRCFAIKVLLEVLQNLQENTYVRDYFLLKKRLWQRCFSVNFVKFLWTLFFIEPTWWKRTDLHCIQFYLHLPDSN